MMVNLYDSAAGSMASPTEADAFPVGGSIKRALDIFLVLLASPIFLLVAFFIAIVIKMEGRGPILFGHRRIGFGAREFVCLKFRTMVPNGDEVLERHLAGNEQAQDLWRKKRKLDADPRVTQVGKLLRKTSLDEIPQFLNVLRGDMSLVGPRPVVREELDYYGDALNSYLRARPGVTGLWQISGRSNTSYAERVQLDHEYVEKWNTLLDIKIFLLTVPAVLRLRGAC